jgi:hypothetical protein
MFRKMIASVIVLGLTLNAAQGASESSMDGTKCTSMFKSQPSWVVGILCSGESVTPTDLEKAGWNTLETGHRLVEVSHNSHRVSRNRFTTGVGWALTLIGFGMYVEGRYLEHSVKRP